MEGTEIEHSPSFGVGSTLAVTAGCSRPSLTHMTSENWSDAENDMIVAAWFTMLGAEIGGTAYNKAAQNRALQAALGRSRGSIEFKLCNISAAAKAFALPVIEGYKPRFNFQMSLAEAISRWLAKHPAGEVALSPRSQSGLAEVGPLFVGVALTLRNSPSPIELTQL